MKWEFLSTWDEWHSFVIGFCEVACPWKPHHLMPLSYHSPLGEEWHYYVVGRVVGFWSLIGLALLIYAKI